MFPHGFIDRTEQCDKGGISRERIEKMIPGPQGGGQKEWPEDYVFRTGRMCKRSCQSVQAGDHRVFYRMNKMLHGGSSLYKT